MSEISRKTSNPNPFFFWTVRIFIILLLLFGIAFSIALENIYHSFASIVMVLWATIFLSYFYWAVVHYNINFGLPKTEWERIRKLKQKKEDGEHVDEDLIDEPKYNPYRAQTFGLPPGTVRGMIAFTLLFGAISLFIVSMGMDDVSDDSFFWDHFEYFKTAFLMMIAFYFGSKSLKYLQRRWPSMSKNVNTTKTTVTNVDGSVTPDSKPEEKSEPKSLGELDVDEDDFKSDDPNADVEIKKPKIVTKVVSEVKENISVATNPPVNRKEAFKLFPVIDAGHGDLNAEGIYTTGNKKMYEFEVEGEKNIKIYEGNINHKIARKLIELLKENNIPYEDLNSNITDDMRLSDRTAKINELYRKNKSLYLISIHSNSASASTIGKGSKATGFEIFTSIGQTKSDKLADIAAKHYKKEFPEFRFRQDMSDDDADKEANFWMLRKSACPAFLVENLFFDNLNEAKFLLSEGGQQRIANCLYKIVDEIYNGEIC